MPPPRLSHRDALDIIDFVMSLSGKRAMLAVLKESEEHPDLDATKSATLRRVKQSFGSVNFEIARTDRFIAGHSRRRLRREVNLVSGRLPGKTKWYIGEPHQPE